MSAATRAIDAFSPPGIAVVEISSRHVRYLVRGLERLDGPRVTRRTVFQIASLTKPFTAIVILKLAERGKLNIDDRALAFLDWLPPRYATVTIRQLLTHTSGVARDLRRGNVDEFSPGEFRARFAESEPSFAPGTRWEYANSGYILLSMIAEKAGGRPFGTLLDDIVFRPAGMHDSRYRAPLIATAGRAAGYDWQTGRWQAAPPVYSGYGNSGIETTVDDLAQFALALQRRRLLNPGSYAAMLKPQKLASGEVIRFDFRDSPTGYGLGWFVSDMCGVMVASHGGTIAGFSANLSWAPDRAYAIGVLSNGKSGANRIGVADEVATAAMRAGLGCAPGQ